MDANVEVKVYKRRFLMLFLSIMNTGLIEFQASMYTSIASVIHDFYSISYVIVMFTSTIFTITFVFLCYLTLRSMTKYGLRHAYVIASFFSALGASVKCLGPSQHNFLIIMSGQFIVAIGKCFIATSTPMLVANWFKSDESATVIGIEVGTLMLAGMVTFWLPSLLFKESDVRIADHLKLINMIVVFLTTTCFVLMVCSIEEKPKLPPTLSQKRKVEQTEKLPLKALLKNRDYVLFSMSLILSLTFDTTLGTLLNQIIYSTFQRASLVETIIGTLLMGFGFVGSICIPIILDKFKKFKLITYIIFSLAVTLFSLIHTCIWLKQEVLLYVVFAFFGFFFYGRYGVLVDIVTEVTYPYPQNIVFGIQSFIKCILTAFSVPALSSLIKFKHFS
ncbi:feline leukemia virus subgroup C receptor-related protein 2-like protein [Dinothrombium tinctorium]|uniref:Feline leukemia virus subgroup C receptor-related protein 2-like protein n=1 Tax=Dinothrombium tinctorium TaxID=1965070 RepID=A0A3S3P794_9ACAR|nr:feline leukemia virus subgroup C receptor-related protein 2-like protein [Dinothrombium tinctorium]